jgi:hypothetical protein
MLLLFGGVTVCARRSTVGAGYHRESVLSVTGGVKDIFADWASRPRSFRNLPQAISFFGKAEGTARLSASVGTRGLALREKISMVAAAVRTWMLMELRSDGSVGEQPASGRA